MATNKDGRRWPAPAVVAAVTRLNRPIPCSIGLSGGFRRLVRHEDSAAQCLEPIVPTD
jgi:hypothetical protein